MSREQYQDKANYYATQAQLDPELFSRLVYKESKWNPNAYNKSSKAAGLTQVIPTTAADPGFGIAPLKQGDAEDSLRFGAQYLGALRNKYKGDIDKALAAYNWGTGYVDSHLAKNNGNLVVSQLPSETQDYIKYINTGNASNTAKPAITSPINTVEFVPVKKPEGMAAQLAEVDDTALKIAEANRDRSVAELERSRLNRPEIEKDKGDGLAKWVMNVPTLTVNTNYRPTKLGKKLNFDLQG